MSKREAKPSSTRAKEPAPDGISRFNSLIGRLVSVPKDEVKQLEDQEKAKRKDRKKRVGA